MTFPLIDLVPKKETNVIQFLQDHPNHDGRNVVVGILDTGIDPGAHSIQYLSDGVTPKLIDVVDCTGSGDVDVSTEKQAVWEDDGYWKLTGLTGRTLQLSSDWKILPFPKNKETLSKKDGDSKADEEKQDTGSSDPKQETVENKKTVQVRLGVKRAFELFPAKLKARVIQERRKIFDEQVGQYVSKVRADLAVWKSKYGNGNKSPTPEQTRVRDDLQARLEVLTDKEWDDDPGPLYDCIVLYDGQDFRAVIDVKETGDVRNAVPMTCYAKERQFGTFGTLDQLNYAVNFYNDGKILSIVSDASPHGTHVAGITAAAEGERSGVAPGAQLVSFKIGDSRLGSMETGTSLTRAMIEAVKHKCDVVNLSYGEGCAVPNSGRFVELLEDLVWKHNVIFVASAGNNGPALSTVGAPGGTSSAAIGVAAYVSPDMMKANYSMNVNGSDETSISNVSDEEKHLGTTYTWSSVGPTHDGDHGVDLSSPGGAITSVSNWCLQKSMLMNGTSMSSPHAAGCVALLVSACKAEGIKVSPARIRRALKNTAQTLPNLLENQQGAGMIHVDKAFEYLKQFSDDPTDDIFFSVVVENLSGSPRGIYLRQMEQSLNRQMFSIRVDPNFRREDHVSEEAQRRKIDFELQFALKSNAEWVTAPDFMMIMNSARSFKIDVDPTGLTPGVHEARVEGIDASKPERGPLFTVPITVVKPLPIENRISFGKLDFDPAEVKRFFVVPPPGATWMDVTVKDCRDSAIDGESSTKLFVLHTVQLLQHAAYRDFEYDKYLSLMPAQMSVATIPVEEGVTCEIALARYWSTLGSSALDVSVEFRGIRPVPNCIQILSGTGGELTRIYSDLRDESVNPSAKLTKWLSPLRPKADPIIAPLGDRDVLPSLDRRIFELCLVYEFDQEEKGALIVRSFALQGVLYESAFESQLMLIFDGEKKYLGAADAWPSEVTAPKGTVVIRVQIRHDDPSKLEKLKDMVIWIERSHEKGIPLSIYPTKEALMTEGGACKKSLLRKGTSASLYVAEPPQSKLPSGCKTGDILKGSITFGSGDSSLPGEGKRPGGFDLSFTVGPKPKKTSTDPETPDPKDERSVEQRMNEAVRDVKVGHLGKLSQKEKEDGRFEELYAKIESEYPDFIPLRMAKLKYLDTHKKRSELLMDIVSASEAVLGLISEDELALHFGKKIDSDEPAAVKERERMKEKKSFLVEALVRMAMAYADMKSDDASKNFDGAVQRLKAWADIDGSPEKYAALLLERETRVGRYGNALKILKKMLAKETKDDVIKPLTRAELFQKRAEIFEKLEYSLLVEYDKSSRVIACPTSYALF